MNAASTNKEKILGNRFVPLRPLTGGGISAPALAFDLQHSKIVVLKRPKHAKDPSRSADTLRFVDEINTSMSLPSHPSLVHPHDSGVFDDGEPYLALEWIQGQNCINLDEKSRKYNDPITLPIMANIVLSVCAALAEATRQMPSFVHRDIAPGNIMVGYDGVTRLIDYGFALSPLKASKTNAGDVPGTPGFVAPERKDGLSKGDIRSDLYSLASVALLLMTGLPLADSATLETPYVVIHTGPLLPFLKRALAPNPDDRYQTIAEFEAALRDAIKEPPADQETVAEFVSALFANDKAEAIKLAEKCYRDYGKPSRPQKTQQLNLSSDGRPIAGPRTVTLPGNGPVASANLAPPPEPESSRQPTLITAPIKKASKETTLVLDAGPADRRRRILVVVGGTVGIAAVAAVAWLAMTTPKPRAEQRTDAPSPPSVTKTPAPPPLPPVTVQVPTATTLPSQRVPPSARPTTLHPQPAIKNWPARTVATPKACASLPRANEALVIGNYDEAAKLATECLKNDPANSKARKLIELIPTRRSR